MRLIFCGTPQFAVPALQYLIAQSNFNVITVITQPDRPRGRGHGVSFSPVKQVAQEAGLPVLQFEKIRSTEAEQALKKFELDFVVIIAYGQIIPARLLPIPKFGWINLHASLLPKYRGAAPINWAIANGETVTGLTTMRIDAGMDTGDILLQREIFIGPRETAPELAARMADAGASLMADTLRGLAADTITSQPQDHAHATLAPLLKKEDGRIDWDRPAREIFNRMRAFVPWPGAYTLFRRQNCHLWGEPVSNELPVTEPTPAPPGTLLVHGNEVMAACGSATLLRLVHVKMEGRKQISAREFVSGAHVIDGERFSQS